MASSELLPSDAGSWYSWVTNYDQTLADFTVAYNNLVSLTPLVAQYAPSELAAHNALVAEGTADLQQLNDLKATRDYVYSWLQWLGSGATDVTNFITSNATAAYNAALSYLGLSGLAGLGIAPMVAVAGVAAAAAVLITFGYYINKAVERYQREQLIIAQVQAGSTPQQAAALADSQLGPSPSASGADNFLGIPWNYVIIGAVVVLLGPTLVETIQKRRG